MTKIENDLLAEIRREYRRVRLEMLGVLNDVGADDPSFFGRIRSILFGLSSRLTEIVNGFLETIRGAIETYARRQFEGLGLEPGSFDFDLLWAETSVEREGILSSLSDRIRIRDTISVIELRFQSALTDMQQAGDDDRAVSQRLFALLPVDGRVSEWRHGKNLLNSKTQKALWGVALAGLMLLFLLLANRLRQRGDGVRLVKMAVATLDSRTTVTCQRVDGQSQPVDKPFNLTGTPRYANKKMLPPFHDYCRTVIELSRKGS